MANPSMWMAVGYQKDFSVFDSMTNQFKTSNFTFFGYPRNISISHYDKAREAIAKYYADTNDVKSICEYGTVTAPGVSDLDIILVLDDDQNKDHISYDFKHLNADVISFVENGNVIKMPVSVYKQSKFVDFFNVKVVSGVDYNRQEPCDEYLNMLRQVSILDWLPERILRISNTLNSGKIDISNALCLLHSFGYSLKNVESILNMPDASVEFLNVISELRSEWGQFQNPESILISALYGALDIGVKYMNLYEIYSKKNHLDSIGASLEKLDSSLEVSLPIHYGQSLNFLNETTILENSRITFSKVFGSHFKLLGSFDNYISSQVSSRLRIAKYYISDFEKNSYADVLRTKSNLMSENYKFLQSISESKGLLRYGLYVG